MENITMNFKTVQDMINSGIIEIKGFSGAKASLDVAIDCPALCQVHSLSGNIYELKNNGTDLILVPVIINYKLN